MARAAAHTYKGNAAGKLMMVERGNFQAGSTAQVYKGELLEYSGGNWVALTSDKAMSNSVGVALSNVASGDLAGYRDVLLPQKEDLFEFDLLSTDSQNPSVGTAVYVSAANSDAHTVTTTAGTNIIGYIVGQDHYPEEQGHQSQDASYDRGTTISNVRGGKVIIQIQTSASRYGALYK